jgi:hypothetical protein
VKAVNRAISMNWKLSQISISGHVASTSIVPTETDLHEI